MTIKLGEFDDIESTLTWGIQEVMSKIKETAPAGFKVKWEYPGYISIVTPKGWEIAFGESLEKDSTYSWNTYDLQGNTDFCDSFADPKDLDLIAAKLWEQVAPAINN